MCLRIESDLPEPFREAATPLLEVLHLDQAMSSLVVREPADEKLIDLCQQVTDDPALADHPAFRAGLWLYVDELERAHEICQDLQTPAGCYWHAVMHRREGDFPNSKYWYRRAGAHPAMKRIDLSGGPGGGGTDVGRFDPEVFVDRVAQVADNGRSPADLVVLQRKEWSAVLAWCAEN